MKQLIFLSTLCFFLFSCDDDNDGCPSCSLSPDAGLCEAAIPKFYFDQQTKLCTEFTWGGCDGVVPFETIEECEQCECN